MPSVDAKTPGPRGLNLFGSSRGEVVGVEGRPWGGFRAVLGPAGAVASLTGARPPSGRGISVLVEPLCLAGLAEPPVHDAALKVGWVASRCEGGRIDGLAKPAEVALDAGGCHDQCTEPHATAAALAKLDIDFKALHQQLTPRAGRPSGAWTAPFDNLGLPFHPSSAASLCGWFDEPCELRIDLHPICIEIRQGSRCCFSYFAAW